MKITNRFCVTVTITVIAAVFCALLPACGTMAAVINAGAQIAGASGVIDQNYADAISNSSKAAAAAAEEITPEQEYYIGRAVAANILGSYKIWSGSPAITAYVNRICAAVTINSPRPDIYNGYHVTLLDSNEINAFATSGGHIFLTRGLALSAKSEDALAGVIAHEIAHIQLQHSIKAIKTSRITQALIVTGTSVAGAYTGMDVNELTDVFNESVGEIVTTMVNNGYSQTQEFEADTTALGLLAAAGYNPSGLTEMLKELNTVQNNAPGGFNKTHPAPAKRLTSAEKGLAKYSVMDTASYRRVRFEVVKI